MTEAELAGHVRRLLWDVGANIDVMPEEDERWSAEGEGDFPFDRGTAFRLYEELIAPLRKALAGKRHLFTSATRSEEHTSELQSLMRISYAVFCLKKKTEHNTLTSTSNQPTDTIKP